MTVSEVEDLPEQSEAIEGTTPLSVLELGGSAEIVISFVMSTRSPLGWFGFVFERESDAWRVIHNEKYDELDEAQGGFERAADSIMKYWQENSELSHADDFETPDGWEVGEYDLDLDPDSYLEYFQ
ncbi:hypothetical protein [Halanaeroarchaeum sp. HSR-CO]|uniref:hypothetical protein n=1 Tax=Halanaeroarchaeum sp. HSR-CO TaxID=2866382 RepID=UPI00217EA14F|nr:hypothetical protein [Halanaeroarchaeum sp. HSR-CO]